MLRVVAADIIVTHVVVAHVVVTDRVVTGIVMTHVVVPKVVVPNIVVPSVRSLVDVTVVADDRRRLAAALIGPRTDLLRRARVLLGGLTSLRGVGLGPASLRLGLRGPGFAVGGRDAVALGLRLQLLGAPALLLGVLLLALARDDHGDDDREGHDDDEDDDEGDDL